MSIAYFNDEFINLAEAKVSVLDRGFLFGDSLYEVIPVYSRKTYLAEPHLERLYRGLGEISLKLDQSQEQLLRLVEEVIEKNQDEHQAIYIHITRGSTEKRAHAMPDTYTPTLLIASFPFNVKTIDELKKGISAVTVEDIRWQRCDIKATTLLGNIMSLQEAKSSDADEAILTRGEFAVEGVSSNLMIVKDGTIITTPLANNILPGITRQFVDKVAGMKKIPFKEADITVEQLFNADEVWLTGSIREITPVITINNKPVGKGKAGPIWLTLIDEYRRVALPEQHTLMTFPCDHTIKAMGLANEAFETAALSIVNSHATIPEHGLKSSHSKNGKYLSLSITINANSKEQLDQIYRELSAHDLVLVAL